MAGASLERGALLRQRRSCGRCPGPRLPAALCCGRALGSAARPWRTRRTGEEEQRGPIKMTNGGWETPLAANLFQGRGQAEEGRGRKKQKEKRTQAHREPLRDIPKDTPGSLPSPLILHSAGSWRLGLRGRTRRPSVVGPGRENRGARSGSVVTRGNPGPTAAPCGSDLGRGANQPGCTC
ncbi:hypothetical protein NDU88_004843 [Pleurodeles waltl]|uniref:Uncharacterized protein n=1 Tax=Pleurodeles waltl TaxID=8319 RepID=A0AAV7SK13_PLEWA|nr:hypothetical protein NDU88_004843 [Pleurodeles waltl]